MHETQRAYGEGYAPETNLREGSGWRAPSRRGLPTPPRPGARPVAARRRRPVPGWLVLLAALLVLLALGTAGSLDMDEAARQADEYCGNVHEGLWPDYEGTYRDRCTADGKPRH